jgi:DNA-binding response OmpR family regulator
MGLAMLSQDFAVRLADEGVPLRAIARATRIPSEDLRHHLHQAQSEGRLLALPHDDWPPGFPRDQRSLQLSRMAVENRAALHRAIQQLYGLTSTEARLMLILVQNDMMPKERDDMTTRTVDVHIYNMRKVLKPFNLAIRTIWGFGYHLLAKDRRRAMDLILQRATTLSTL